MQDVDFIAKKTFEYWEKISSNSASKSDIRCYVIFVRILCRIVNENYISARDNFFSFKRNITIMKNKGISIPLADAGAQHLKNILKIVKKHRVEIGKVAANALSLWQSSGATLQEFCNLCNKDFDELKKDMERLNDDTVDFVKLVYVYNIDYKDPRNTEWIDDTIDAPFTHTINEYLLDDLLHNKEAKQKMQEGLFEFFPSLREKAFRIYKDEEGEEHFVDIDGVERQPEEFLSDN